jgi:hypothetical protein
VIEQSAARNLVHGFGDGTYRPGKNITRAEFVQMLVNVLELPYSGTAAVYADVAPTQWFHPAIAAAKQAGLLEGLADTGDAFMPSRQITRQEMALVLANTVIARNIMVEREVDMTLFGDLTDIDDVYLSAIEVAISADLLSVDGVGSGRFSPMGVMTRAQAAQVQMNLLGVLSRQG